jgi:hypothetical protein
LILWKNFIVHPHLKLQRGAFADIQNWDCLVNWSRGVVFVPRKVLFDNPWSLVSLYGVDLGMQLTAMNDGYDAKQNKCPHFHDGVEYSAPFFAPSWASLRSGGVSDGEGFYRCPNNLVLPVLAFISAVILGGVGIGMLIIKV